MSYVKIKLGGVPEHFNLPIHLAIENGSFEKNGIDLEWINCPGGTGQMTTALRNGECDICVLLTEGIITDIINGNPSKIVSGYVKSPLIWGVHTGQESNLQSHDEIFNQKIAISRIGSGSHLMPTVDALLKGEKMSQEQFVTVQNIDGALLSLNKGETDVFYWEKYTTKPYVSQGLLRRIGEFISPWPCFMIAATNDIIDSNPIEVDNVLKIIHSSCRSFMENPNAVNLVSEKYNIKPNDAKFWFHGTEWATDSWVSNKMLLSVLFTLKEAGIVGGNSSSDSLVWKRK
jgi:sulfonate transport system substrate-binding protein